MRIDIEVSRPGEGSGTELAFRAGGVGDGARGIETEVGKRIGWERELAVQVRLEKAAELGKLEREQASVQRSMLDLSGIKAARRERDRGLGPRAKEPRERPGMDPAQRNIFDGLALEGRPATDPNPAHAQPSPELPAEASSKPADSPALDLEQIKARGRAAIQDVKQALQAEKALEQQRALEREREAERSRGRRRQRFPGMKTGFIEVAVSEMMMDWDAAGVGAGGGKSWTRMNARSAC